MYHQKRKPLRKGRKQLVSKRKTPSDNRMREFFLSIWSKRPHRSEVSGAPLGNEPLTIFFHHILPKEIYKYAEYDEENIVLLTFEEHTITEADMYKYDTINKRREHLIKKYDRQGIYF